MSTAALTEHPAKRQRYILVLLDVMSRPSGAIGLSLVVFHVCLAIISPVIAPYDFKLQDASLPHPTYHISAFYNMVRLRYVDADLHKQRTC